MITNFLDNYDILLKTIVFFIGICYLLNQYKPEIMFHENGDYKTFGNGSKKTILPYWLVTKCAAILFYLYLVVRTDDFIM